MKLLLKPSIKSLRVWGLICIVLLLYSCKFGMQVTDQSSPDKTASPSPDNILFDVSLRSSTCKSVKEPIEVILTFTNPNDSLIRLADQFLISKNRFGSGGNIIPFITLDGEDIYSLRDNSTMDIPLPKVNNYIEIPPYGLITKSVRYYFPAEILESELGNNPEIIITPSPGTYHITFTYYQIKQAFDSWYGHVRSDQVEICIIN